jgi:hypothetical protein
MNRILLLVLGLLIFGCDQKKQPKNQENPETQTEESVEIGAGSEISPQLEGVADSATRMKVDPVSSAQEEATQQQKEEEKAQQLKEQEKAQQQKAEEEAQKHHKKQRKHSNIK